MYFIILSHLIKPPFSKCGMIQPYNLFVEQLIHKEMFFMWALRWSGFNLCSHIVDKSKLL